MWNRPFFHQGMRTLQDRFDGRRVADAIEAHHLHRAFLEEEKAVIRSAAFFFFASAWNGYVDCSMKSGEPGFVQILDENLIEYPDYDGNSMYRTLGNLSRNPNCGLLFVDFEGRKRRIRVNGRASLHADKESLGRHIGARLVVRIKCEIYPNCSRYMPDLMPLRASREVPRAGEGTLPPPSWKRLEHIRDLLPNDDPHAAVVASPSPDPSLPPSRP